MQCRQSWLLVSLMAITVSCLVFYACKGEPSAEAGPGSAESKTEEQPRESAPSAVQPVDASPEEQPVGNETSVPPLHNARGRVILLGFDGVEPSIVDAMLEAGELPNLDQLRKQGVYKRLGSSNPPQSPTAWSSFATCKNPGNHGIYDFLRPDPKRYFPQVGFGIAKHPELTPSGEVTKFAEFTNYRKGATFWAVANQQGARCKLFTVPFAYPADRMEHSCMLCGLDIRDIRGTQSTFFAMSDAITEQESVPGGLRLPLKFDGDTAVVEMPGARDPRVGSSTAPGAWVEVPVRVVADREAHKVMVTIQGQEATLAENTWSEWFEWTFEVSPTFTVRAISRIRALEVGKQVRLYMTCLQYHPRAPYIPISDPESYSAELADRYGLYKTIGWVYDTKAVQRDEMPEDLFLDDVEKTMAWREMLTLDELDRGDFDLLIAGWTATDRVAHLFWRFRDPKHPLYTEAGANKYGRAVENTYLKMDQIVGNVMAKVTADDLLIVFSDHGFHSFRRGFNVNTWLEQNGYLTVKDRNKAMEGWLFGIDWTATRAYNLGLGSVFLNRKGREAKGTVDPADAPALLEELRTKLLAVTDPKTGDQVLRAVYIQPEVYVGVAESEAPDLELGYAEGYQTTKLAAKGGVGAELFEPNLDKWSGEHAASDVAFTPGILFANRPLADNPAIIDLGPTALTYLGLTCPGDFEGESLTRVQGAAMQPTN